MVEPDQCRKSPIQSLVQLLASIPAIRRRQRNLILLTAIFRWRTALKVCFSVPLIQFCYH